MKRTFYILILLTLSLLFIPQNIHAQDTISVSKKHSLEQLVVTGTRAETDVRHLSQTVSVVNRSKIESRMQPSLLPMLTEQVPGLFTTSRGIMGYGVSGGAAGSISLRGLSGGNARIMVLIDGHPQYAGIFGHPISDAYQSLLADKVEVLRGPASMLYGSNAMGGVLNIVTRKMHEDGIKTDIHVGYGSYNTLETEATNRIRKGRFSSVISVSYNQTNGHRENMDFEQYGGYAKFGYKLNKHWNTYADVNITHFNATYPGPQNAPLLEGDQRITRGVASFTLKNKYEYTSGGMSFFYNWGDHWINDGYTPSAGESPQDGRFNSFDDMMGFSLYQNASFFENNRITFGFDWFNYGGEAWTEFIKGKKKGTRSDLIDKHENEFAGYVDFRQGISQWVTINAGLRADYHSQVGTEWIPQVGLAFHLPHDMELKASISKGFRYPILREMYMFPPQNPDLQPESIWDYELAFSQRLFNGSLQYGLNLFYIDGKDMIITLPTPNGNGMLNQNSGKIKNKGLEVQVAYRINNAWSTDANYSFLHMEKPVIAAPEQKLYTGINYSKDHWNISTGLQCIHGLYTQIATNGKETNIQENFTLWNIQASYRLSDKISIWLRCENLLAERYEINAGYPMPKATLFGGLHLNL